MEIYNAVSIKCSRAVTRSYSTSFSAGISLLHKKFHDPLYSIYGFVRLADEIVDSFHRYDQQEMLDTFREDTFKAIAARISLNPVLQSFQHTVNKYQISHELIVTFLNSMQTDLQQKMHTQDSLDVYVNGSAEVVGLMCLTVFCEGDHARYLSLKEPAMKLGSAFQKVNFLRDLAYDKDLLGRQYFPQLAGNGFTDEVKDAIVKEIEAEFADALPGIFKLPEGSRLGVYSAYLLFRRLLLKIKSLPASRITEKRIKISTPHKLGLFIEGLVRHRLNLI